MQCGEQALLPAVREADRYTLVIANGFSCKTQIEQGDTGRHALHVAQAIKMAREHGPAGYRDGPPEQPYSEIRPAPPAGRRAARVGAVAGIALAAGAALARAAARD
jgi:hypothetical protein